jgi:hypothetical protein
VRDSCDDLPVGLKGLGTYEIKVGEGRLYFSTRTERAVEAGIAVITRQCEVGRVVKIGC